MFRKPCEMRSSREIIAGVRIHSDLCSMDVELLSGKKYFVLFKNETSALYQGLYFIKEKTEMFDKLRDFVNK